MMNLYRSQVLQRIRVRISSALQQAFGSPKGFFYATRHSGIHHAEATHRPAS